MLARPLHLPIPYTPDLVSALSFLWHFYLSSMSHTYIPLSSTPLHTIYLMGSLLSHIFTWTDSYLSFSSLDGLYSLDVSRRLVNSTGAHTYSCHFSHGYRRPPF